MVLLTYDGALVFIVISVDVLKIAVLDTDDVSKVPLYKLVVYSICLDVSENVKRITCILLYIYIYITSLLFVFVILYINKTHLYR